MTILFMRVEGCDGVRRSLPLVLDEQVELVDRSSRPCRRLRGPGARRGTRPARRCSSPCRAGPRRSFPRPAPTARRGPCRRPLRSRNARTFSAMSSVTALSLKFSISYLTIDLAVVEVARHPLLLVLVDRPLDDDVLGHAHVEPHLVVQRRELAPVLAEEGRRRRGRPPGRCAPCRTAAAPGPAGSPCRSSARSASGTQELVLRPVEVAELLRIGGVGLLDRHLLELLDRASPWSR